MLQRRDEGTMMSICISFFFLDRLKDNKLAACCQEERTGPGECSHGRQEVESRNTPFRKRRRRRQESRSSESWELRQNRQQVDRDRNRDRAQSEASAARGRAAMMEGPSGKRTIWKQKKHEARGAAGGKQEAPGAAGGKREHAVQQEAAAHQTAEDRDRKIPKSKSSESKKLVEKRGAQEGQGQWQQQQRPKQEQQTRWWGHV